MRLIDADDLLERMKFFKDSGGYTNWELLAFEMVDASPTVDTKRHGHWIVIGKRTDCEYVLIFKCSCCHTPFIGMVDRYHYCPNCGAKVDEIEEGEVVVTKKEIERIKDCANFSKMDEVEE